MRRRLIAVLAALAVAACGEIPQPFRHDGAPPPLTRPKMARGLTIRPAELPDGDRLAAAVAKALEVHDIPATVRSGPAFGHIVEAAAGERDGARGLQWRLIAPGEQPEDIRFQRVTTGPGDTAVEAAATAAALARRLEDPDSAPPKGAPPVKRTSVRVVPFRDLPGDGDRALLRATRDALERGGLVVASDGGDYMVEGQIMVIPGLPGEDTVAMNWIVRTPDGKEFARVTQEGVVPRGRLGSPWGSLARDIAEGGAIGIRDVIRTAANGP
jgi:hypothetical protein